MIYKCFLNEWNRIKKFWFFSNFDQTRIPGPDEKSSNWLVWILSSFYVKLWKSVKMIKFKCKDDLQVFSYWMEQI